MFFCLLGCGIVNALTDRLGSATGCEAENFSPLITLLPTASAPPPDVTENFPANNTLTNRLGSAAGCEAENFPANSTLTNRLGSAAGCEAENFR
jgi:hypothetical protein